MPLRHEGHQAIRLRVDGRDVEVPGDGRSLLEVLRDDLGVRGPKDGCSPQGQCGCCTVLVDGQPRVACVTPVRRVAGRAVTTVAGLGEGQRAAWADAFLATGASQCGFCTPGIIVRLAALRDGGAGPGDTDAVERALNAHLCRCTGWRTILDAWSAFGRPPAGASPAARDLDGAARRATLEGGVAQRVAADVPLGAGGFADDTAPEGALVAVPDGAGGWAVGETLAEARSAAGKVQGRRTTIDVRHPIDVPPGSWDVVLRTTWVEPAYLETDASWCVPGGEPATPLANGGAFGGKTTSPAPGAARHLADRHGRPVRVLLSREDTVRLGAKRPPLAAGARADGTGVVRVARTPGIAEAIERVAPGVTVEQVDIAGPPTSAAIRGAGWVEALVLLAGARAQAAGDTGPVTVEVAGGEATALVSPGGVHVRVSCGDPLDEIVLRSYCVGAAHMALGLVRSEAIAVDEDGDPRSLTVRSFGILRACDMPAVRVEVERAGGPPVNGSDAVLASVAASAWIVQGCPAEWPTDRRGREGAGARHTTERGTR